MINYCKNEIFEIKIISFQFLIEIKPDTHAGKSKLYKYIKAYLAKFKR